MDRRRTVEGILLAIGFTAVILLWMYWSAFVTQDFKGLLWRLLP